MSAIRKGLVMAVDDARAEGDREERESGVEVRRVLERVRGRRRKVRVSAVYVRPLALDGDRDCALEDDAPLPVLPPEGCSLFEARPHLFDPREQARDAANDVLDTCTALAGARSFADVTRAAHELRQAAQILTASAATLERIYAHARGKK